MKLLDKYIFVFCCFGLLFCAGNVTDFWVNGYQTHTLHPYFAFVLGIGFMFLIIVYLLASRERKP